MAETFESQYEEYAKIPEFASTFGSVTEFEDFIQENEDASDLLKSAYGIEFSEVKKKDETESFTFQSPSVGEASEVPEVPMEEAEQAPQLAVQGGSEPKQEDPRLKSIRTALQDNIDKIKNNQSPFGAFIEIQKLSKSADYQAFKNNGKINDLLGDLNETFKSTFLDNPSFKNSFNTPKSKQDLENIGIGMELEGPSKAKIPTKTALGKIAEAVEPMQPELPALDPEFVERQEIEARLYSGGDIAQRGMPGYRVEQQAEAKEQADEYKRKASEPKLSQNYDYDGMGRKVARSESQMENSHEFIQPLTNDLRDYVYLSQQFPKDDVDKQSLERSRQYLANKIYDKVGETILPSILPNIKDNFDNISEEGVFLKRDADGFFEVDNGYIAKKLDEYFTDKKPGEEGYVPDSPIGNEYRKQLRGIIEGRLRATYRAVLDEKNAQKELGEFKPSVDETEVLNSMALIKSDIEGTLEQKKLEFKSLLDKDMEEGTAFFNERKKMLVPENFTTQEEYEEAVLAFNEEVNIFSSAVTERQAQFSEEYVKFAEQKEKEYALRMDDLQTIFANRTSEEFKQYQGKKEQFLKEYRQSQIDKNAFDFGDGNKYGLFADFIQSSVANLLRANLEFFTSSFDIDNNFLNRLSGDLASFATGNAYMGNPLSKARSFSEGFGGFSQQLIDQIPTLVESYAINSITGSPMLASTFLMYSDMARETISVRDDIMNSGGSVADADRASKKIVEAHLQMTPLYLFEGSLLFGNKIGSLSYGKNFAKGFATQAGLETLQEFSQQYTSDRETGRLLKEVVNPETGETELKQKSVGEWLATTGKDLVIDIIPTVATFGAVQARGETKRAVEIEKQYSEVSKILGEKQQLDYFTRMYNVMGENVVYALPDMLRFRGEITQQQFNDLKANLPGYIEKIKETEEAGVMNIDDARYYVNRLQVKETLEKQKSAAKTEGGKAALQKKIDLVDKSLNDVIEGKETPYVKLTFSGGFSLVMDNKAFDAFISSKSKQAEFVIKSLTNETRDRNGNAVPIATLETQDAKLNKKLNDLFQKQEQRTGAQTVTGMETAVDNKIDFADDVNVADVATNNNVSETSVRARFEQARKAQEILNEAMPGVEIVMLNDADYKALMPKVGGNVNSNGNFSYEYDSKTKSYKAQIQINAKSSNSRTINHELTHALLLQKFGEDLLAYEDFKKGLSKVLKDSDIENLEKFATSYAELDKSEEFLAEGGAAISEAYEGAASDLKKSKLQNIASYVSNYVSNLTGGQVNLFKDLNNVDAAIDFFNTLSQKTNAVQEQTTSQVPVQPETAVSEEVAQGETQAEPEVATQEGQEVSSKSQVNVVNQNNIETEQGDILVSAYVDPNEIQSKSQSVFQPVDISWTIDPVSGMTLNVPTERKTMYDVVLESGGAVVIANSDGTGIGKVVDGQTLQGGIGYSFIQENINDGIGFAASDDAKIPSIWEAAQEAARLRDAQNPEMAGKPVAVFVMVQTPGATFGNAYSASYFGTVLKSLTKDKGYSTTEAKKEIVEFINDFRTNNEIGKKYNDAFAELVSIIRNTDFTKPEAIQKITDILITEKKRGLPKNASKELVAENNKRFGFDARRAFFEKFFVGVGKASSNQAANKLRNYLKEKGFGQENFYEKYLDENILKSLEGQTPAKKLQDGGFAMTGFFVDPNLSKEDFIKKSKEGTYQHKQFNSKFYGINPFVLNGKYYVNEMFPEASFNASEAKGGKDIPVTASAAMSLYPRTRKGQAADIIERAKGFLPQSKSQLIQPSSDKWSPSLTQAEVDAVVGGDFGNTLDEKVKEGKKHSTQIATTIGTYNKWAGWLEQNVPNFKNAKVLDVGAGLGHIHKAFKGKTDNIESYEPFYDKEQYQKYAGVQKPNYFEMDASDVPVGEYDVVVNNAVLNVVPADIRESIVNTIGNAMKPGGIGILNSMSQDYLNSLIKKIDRGASKNIKLSDTEVFVRESGKNSYQKGWTNQELQSYVQDVLGDGFTVEKAPSAITSMATVLIRKNEVQSKSQQVEATETDFKLPFGKFQGQWYTTTPKSYRDWLSKQPWFDPRDYLKKPEIQSKSQLDANQINVEFNQITNQGGSVSDALDNLLRMGYGKKDIQAELGKATISDDLYNKRIAEIGYNAFKDIQEKFADRKADLMYQIQIRNNMPLGDIRAEMLSEGYNDIEIFNALVSGDFALVEELEEVFGSEFRNTVKNLFDQEDKIANLEFLEDMSQDARNAKITHRLADVVGMFQESGLVFADASIMIEYLLNEVALPSEIAAKELRKQLGDLFDELKKTPGMFEKDVQMKEDLTRYSQLLSFAGRILATGRGLFPKSMTDIIEQSLAKDGVVLTAKQRATLENLVDDFDKFTRAEKEKLAEIENGDISDQMFAQYQAAQKDLGMANVRLMQFLNARKPTYWNEVISSGGSRGLLNLSTVVLSLVSNVENLIYTSWDPFGTGVRKIRNAYGDGIVGNTLSFRNWRLAYSLSRRNSLNEMNMAAKYGNLGGSIDKNFDNFGSINFFREPQIAYKYISTLVKQIAGKEPWSMTDEEFVDAMDLTLQKLQDGSIKTRNGKTYNIAKAMAFSTIGVGSQITEGIGRTMAYGGDIAFGKLAATRAMIDYFTNTNNERFKDGLFENFLGGDSKLSKEGLRSMITLMSTYSELNDKFEEFGLRRVFMNDNFFSKIIGSGRGFFKKAIRERGRKINRGEVSKFGTTALVKQLAQVVDVTLWAAMPFIKVPVNFLGSAIAKTNPLVSLPKYFVSEVIYDKAWREFKTKYPEGKEIKNKKEYEKAKVDLFLKKRQVTHDSAQVVTSLEMTMLGALAYASGALVVGGDPEKEKQLKTVNLKGNTFNITLFGEYVAALMQGKDVKNFFIKRGGHKPGDRVENISNFGIAGYGMGFWGSYYQKIKESENKQIMDVQQPGAGIAYVMLQQMFGSGIQNLPMLQGVARLAELVQESREDQNKVTRFAAGNLSTMGATFFPSFGSFVSKGKAENIQNANDILPSTEDDNFATYMGQIGLQVVQKLSRNVPVDLDLNPYYEASIGLLGEDLSYRVTLSEPKTLSAYIEAMFNPFQLRKLSPGLRENEDQDRYVQAVTIAAKITNYALMYENLTGRTYPYTYEGKQSDIYTLITAPVKNQFTYDGTYINTATSATDKPNTFNYKLSNEEYRKELKLRGDIMYEQTMRLLGELQQFDTDLQLAVQDNDRQQIQNTLEEAFKLYDTIVTEANATWKDDYTTNREKDYLIRAYKVGSIPEADLKRVGVLQ